MGDSDWRKYEKVAHELLNRFAADFGLSRVEEKQPAAGEITGTSWELDAKGVRDGDGAVVIVECRRHTTKALSQEQLAGLAYRILDTGAQGGICVTPLGFQEGAKKVAAAATIIEVKLSPDSTATDFAMSFLNKIFRGVSENVGIGDVAIAVIDRGRPPEQN